MKLEQKIFGRLEVDFRTPEEGDSKLPWIRIRTEMLNGRKRDAVWKDLNSENLDEVLSSLDPEDVADRLIGKKSFRPWQPPKSMLPDVSDDEMHLFADASGMRRSPEECARAREREAIAQIDPRADFLEQVWAPAMAIIQSEIRSEQDIPAL